MKGFGVYSPFLPTATARENLGLQHKKESDK